ncbi:MAG: PAS domain S-box protein, partial [Planctomycetes bacterium]|nr:PAS domain S-box protein [Planctomycetota bacterium]
MVHGSEGYIPGCPLQKMLHSRQRERAELKVPDTNRWLLVTVDPVTDKEGNLVGVVHITRDITERKRAEQALLESEKRYRQLVSTMTDAMMLFDVETRQFIDVNEACEELYEYSREEFLKLRQSDITAEPEKSEDSIDKLLKGQLKRVPVRYHKKKNGALFPVEISGSSFVYEGRRVLCGIIRDITERKRAEEAYRSIVDHSLQGLAIFQDGRVVFANQAMAGIIGYTVEEMLASPSEQVLAFVHPDDHELVWNRYRDRLNGEELPERYEFRGIHKDGSVCWVEIHASRIEYQGKPAIQAACVDITERKRAEESLRQESLMRNTLLDNLPCIAMILKKGTREIVAFNENARKIGAVPGKKCYETCAQRDDPCPFCRAPELWATGESRRIEVEYRGTYYEGIWVPLTEDLYVHYIFDISERKQAEQSLQEAEAELKHTIEVVPCIIAKANAHTGYFTHCNPALSSILGFSSEEFLARPFIEFIHPDDRQSTINEVEKQLKGSPVAKFENRYICKDGSYKWLEWRATAADEKGVVYAAATDITERKKAEHALTESEEKYRRFYEDAPLGYQSLDASGNFLDVNKTWLNVLGYSKEEVIGRLFADFVAPESLETFVDDFHRFKESGQTRGTEFEMLRKDGSRITVSFDGNIEYDEEGRFRRTHCIMHNITERKKAEEALRESEEHYRMLTETMNDGLGQVDENGRYVYVNNKFGEMLGYSPDEMVGRHWTAFFDENAQKITNEQLIKRRKGISKPYELENTRKDGQKIFIHISPQGIFDADNRYMGSFAIMTDITGRKQADEQIEKLAKFPAEDPNPVLRISGHGTVIYANKASLPLLKVWRCCVGQSLPNPWHEFVLDALSSGQNQQTEAQCDERIFSLTFTPIVKANYVNIYGLDITERKKAEERLLEHQAKLKAMASEMLLTEERERQRLAVGLHDEVCQKLVFTKLALESSMQLVSDSKVLASLRIACGAIGETIEQADSLTFELSNPVLRQLGFVIALEKYLTEEIRQKHGIAFELESDEQLGTLQDEIKNCLFRVTRELLTNV